MNCYPKFFAVPGVNHYPAAHPPAVCVFHRGLVEDTFAKGIPMGRECL